LRTKERKYKVEARRLRKTIAKLARAGNPNVDYYDLFLAAEQWALDKKYDKAEEAYEAAIQTAAEKGSLHHLGLINERYSDYPTEERHMEDKAKDRLEGMGCYREGGSIAVETVGFLSVRTTLYIET